MRDWQISGVTRLLSGAPITPSCSSNNAGIQNSNPSLTDGITSARARWSGIRSRSTPEQIAANKNLPFADQVHFNVAAFAMAQPNGNVGNFGNTPVGILRQPTWHEWDITLARRFPVTFMGRKNSGVKLQFQAFNVFNEVQFTNMNAQLHIHRHEQLAELQREHREIRRDGRWSGGRDDRAADDGSDGAL